MEEGGGGNWTKKKWGMAGAPRDRLASSARRDIEAPVRARVE